MPKLSRQVGTTSQIVEVFIQDTSQTGGQGLTGLVYNTGSLTCYYKRNTGTASVAVTLSTITTLGTYAGSSTGGAFKVVDATNMPGTYELHLPNTALGSGADSVVFYLFGATNMAPLLLEVELTATNNQDAVHGGMSALPNTACTTNASLLTSGTGTDQLSVTSGKVLLQATQSGVTIPTVTTVTNQLTAAAIATGVWQDTTSGDFTTASSIGKSLFTSGAVPGAAGGLFLSGTNAATTVNFTGNLSGSVGSVTGAVGSVTGAVGSVTGAVGSVTGAVGSVTAAVNANAQGIPFRKLSILAGSTSQTINVFIGASNSTTGAGLTGLAYNTGSLTAYYILPKANSSVISLATLASPTAAWATGGFKEIDSTNCPGWYRLDLPNAVIASGRFVTVHLQGAANMVPTPIEIELTAVDNQNATTFGIGALPNTACTTNASLLTSGTGTDQISVSSGKVLLQATQSGVTIPTVTTVTNQLTAAAIATGVWQDTTSGDFTTASSIGKSLYTSGVVPGGSGGLFLAGSNAATTVNFTGNLSGSVGSVTGAVGSVTGAVGSITGVTFPSGFSSLTTAAIATGVWQDTTSGDFTTASSIGLRLFSGIPQCLRNTNTAQAGAASTITLDSGASATNSLYNNEIIVLTGGTGAGQSAIITGYVGSTKVATINGTWATNPDSSTTFQIIPFGSIPGATAPTAAQVATAVWQDTTSGDFTVASSIGKSLYTSGVVPGASGGLFISGSNAATTVNFTGNLSGSVGSVTGAVGSISGVTFPSGFSSLTTAAIATGVWQDSTSGDFTTASSIGKSLYTSGVVPGAAGGLFISGTNTTTTVNFTGNLSGSVGSVTGAVGSVTGAVGSISGVTFPSGFSSLTAAAIATATWTDTTSGDFTTTSSPGKILVTQLGGAFSSTSSSVYSTASLVNAPTGGSAPTVGQIATAVWTDLLSSSDFSTASSVGALVKANTVASVSGAVGSISGVTFPSGFSSLTTATIATGVWQDTTGADFTTANSIGHVLYANIPQCIRVNTAAAGTSNTITLDGAASTQDGLYDNQIIALTGGLGAGQSAIITGYVGAGRVATINGTWAINPDATTTFQIIPFGSVAGATAPTAAQVATAVWQDTTSGDFSVTSSPGKILVTQLGGAFSTTSSSIFSTASLANAPTGGSAPTTAQIATAVWQDLTSSADFTTTGSIGKLLATYVVAPTTAAIATAILITPANKLNTDGSGNVTASSVTDKTGYSLATSQTFSTTGSVGTANALGSTAQTEVAAAVWNATQSSYLTAGTTGLNLSVAAAYPDPWSITVPGSYSSGTAGYAIGHVSGATDPWTIALPGSYTSGEAGYILGHLPTAAQNATAVWTDTTGGDFTTTSSPGKILVTQLGGTFTSTSSSVFSTASLANGPSGSGSSPSAIATAVWEDLLAGGDFGTAGSIGHLLATYTVAPTTAAIATAILVTPGNKLNTDSSGNVTASSVTDKTGYSLATSQTFSTTGAVGTVNALGGTAQTNVAAAVWNAAQATYMTAGTTGLNLAVAASGSSVAVDSSGHVTLAAAGLDQVFPESGVNARQALAVIGAACAGTASGLSTNAPVYKGMNNSTTRISATTDSSGDRTAVTLDLP